MGKNLRSRECGKGICQRKDGKCSIPYIARDGIHREKHFDTFPEVRNWLANSQYEDKHIIPERQQKHYQMLWNIWTAMCMLPMIR